MSLALLASSPLGASPLVRHAALASSEPAAVFQAPDWTIGYYATIWTPDISRANGGDESTLGVQFTGEWLITPALTALGIKKEKCDATQKSWCDGQVTYAVSTGKSEDEARRATIEEVDSCAQCLMTEEDKKTMAPPFSARAKNPNHRGAQYLSLGGGANAPDWEVGPMLDDFVDGSAPIAALKEAGFAGVCFDIEGTKGGQELIDAFERAFAVLRKNGLDVMITTSHSAPYGADSDDIRIAMVKSWVESSNVGYLSPQLYTSGGEGTPQLEALMGVNGDIPWDLYKGAKAKFVPSIVNKGQVGALASSQPQPQTPTPTLALASPPAPTPALTPTLNPEQVGAVKKFFEGEVGVKVDGFITWGQEHTAAADPLAPPTIAAPVDACAMKGICTDSP